MDLEKENVYLKDIIKTKRQKEDREKVENIDKNLGIFKEYLKYLDSNNKFIFFLSKSIIFFSTQFNFGIHKGHCEFE